MAILNLSIGKSRYTIDCAEEEGEKILSLGEKLNERVNNLSSTIRNTDEKTILMLCALTIEEELRDLKNSKEIKPESQKYNLTGEDLEDAAIAQIEEMTDYIVSLTKKISAL